MNKNNLIFVGLAFFVGVLVGLYSPTNNDMGNLSKDKAQLEKTINEGILMGKAEANISKIGDRVNLTELTIDVQGKRDELYVDDSGLVYYAKIADLKQVTADKPKVELFVMSYCPFGTQAEKGYLPAIEKLGDKIDAKVKFVNYVMHPAQGEGEENLLQYCIQEENPEKFNSYLGCFLEAGDTEGCLVKNGITRENLQTCLDSTDKKYNVLANLKDKSTWLNGRFPKFNIQDDLNKKYDVKGSPTLVINGRKIENVGRDANSMFKAICSTFTTQPEVCKETLSTETPKSGFGVDGASENNSSEGGCGA